MTSLLLGNRLLEKRLINEDQLHIALREQVRRQRPLGRILGDLSFISDQALYDVLAEQTGSPRLSEPFNAESTALRLLPEALARQYECLPLRLEADGRRLSMASSAPPDRQREKEIREYLKAYEISFLLASPEQIARGIAIAYGHRLLIDDMVAELESPGLNTGNSREGPAVRLIDALLGDATRKQASDIHFEPEAHSLRIRYRMDGILHSIRVLHRSCWPMLCGRIKVLAGMNIAESRAAQDGRISMRIDGRPIDFRVASQPTLHGENIVLRVLDREKGIMPLEQLGIPTPSLVLIEQLLLRPDGLLLVCGPTGSGKTTTLYSLLKRLNSESTHIMTLEDPVEYPLPGIRQTSLSDNIKLDFASGVRSMLRQDPDIMLIGEVRDPETAQMALRATLTGHRVFATLHASDALGALLRLDELGIGGRQLQGSLAGILAQRLVRRLCPACRSSRPASQREKQLLGNDRVPSATGCPACHHTGYRGRLALTEVIKVSCDVDELIGGNAPLARIREQALREGYLPMHLGGMAMIKHGLTTFEEVQRTINLDR